MMSCQQCSQFGLSSGRWDQDFEQERTEGTEGRRRRGNGASVVGMLAVWREGQWAARMKRNANGGGVEDAFVARGADAIAGASGL